MGAWGVPEASLLPSFRTETNFFRCHPPQYPFLDTFPNQQSRLFLFDILLSIRTVKLSTDAIALFHVLNFHAPVGAGLTLRPVDRRAENIYQTEY